MDSTDRSMMGLLSTIGIEKGKPFKPDAAMKKIYAAASADAATVSDAPTVCTQALSIFTF